MLAIYKILPDERSIATYLKDQVMAKLFSAAEISSITYEKVLLLRLSCDVAKNSKNQRLPEFLENLGELIPEFEVYKQICVNLVMMPEPNIEDLSKKIGFNRRAILGEWIRFSLQLNLEDEVIRNSVVSLIFEMASKIEFSYNDYEFLLGEGKQLLSNKTANQIESGELENFELEDFPMNGDEQHLEIVIRTFNELPIKRPYQEFCKPFNQEILT